MASVSKTTLESGAHKNVYDKVNDRSLVVDPRYSGTSSVMRRFVYYADPLHKHTDFSDFPYIVVLSPTLSYTHTSVDGKHKNVGWKQQIIVRSVQDGSSNTENPNVPQGISDMWGICDDLHSLFNGETNKAAFRALEMYEMNLEKVDFSDDVDIMEKSVYETTYELTYYTRMAVSD